MEENFHNKRDWLKAVQLGIKKQQLKFQREQFFGFLEKYALFCTSILSDEMVNFSLIWRETGINSFLLSSKEPPLNHIGQKFMEQLTLQD